MSLFKLKTNKSNQNKIYNNERKTFNKSLRILRRNAAITRTMYMYRES